MATGYNTERDACLDFFKTAADFNEDEVRYHFIKKADPTNKHLADVYKIDITGWDAFEVVRLLKSIVNRRDYLKDTSMFTFEIKSSPNENPRRRKSKVFRLRPDPTTAQPGNGWLSKAPTYNTGDLHDSLEKVYNRSTRRYAQDIKMVFKNNSKIFEVTPPARAATLAATYMLLLFEIGRRLVSTSTSNLDKLPIGTAIAKFVKLLEDGNCSFEDVFSKGKKFHCFSYSCEDRKSAIDKINAALPSLLFTKSELQEMFCKDNQDQNEDAGGNEDEDKDEPALLQAVSGLKVSE